MKIKITTDVFFIIEQLKELDPSYYVLFNTETGKYEVHSSMQSGSSYCFSVPFDSLDARTVDHALKTRIANKDKIIAEIDKENELMMKRAVKEELNNLEEALS